MAFKSIASFTGIMAKSATVSSRIEIQGTQRARARRFNVPSIAGSTRCNIC